MDQLGLPEYFAMEAYDVRKGGEPLASEILTTAELAAPPRHRRASDHPGGPGGRTA